jgi:uncharacterized Zn finger protein (UPF0148 family)
MTSEIKSCPKCGAILHQRLGDLECDNCGPIVVTHKFNPEFGLYPEKEVLEAQESEIQDFIDRAEPPAGFNSGL